MDYLEEQGIELPSSDPNNEEEEEEQEEEGEEEDDEEEEEEEDEEDEEVEHDGDVVDSADVGGLSGMTSSQVLYDNHENDINLTMATTLSQEVVNADHPPSENTNDVTVEVESRCSSQRMDIDDSKGGATASLKGTNDEENGEFNRGEIDGLFCPICFEAWSSGGDHHVCCLPCGHIYGLSCIEKWLRRPGSSKCPQCKKKCEIKDIRLLYASRIVATDGELQKTLQSLEAKCASLEKKSTEWSKKEVEWKKREVDLCKQVRYLQQESTEWSKKEVQWKKREVDLCKQVRYLQESTEWSKKEVQWKKQEVDLCKQVRYRQELVQGTSSSDEGGKQAVEAQAQPAKEVDRWAATHSFGEILLTYFSGK